jgi:hypothetical protein
MLVTRARALGVAGAFILFFGGFAAGFIACVQERSVAKTAARPLDGQHSGDAPAGVREGILNSLQLFQAGYVARDPSKIDSFMHDLVDPDGGILIVGTDESHWTNGYSAAAQFVRNDWVGWGDLRLNLDDPFVSSWQDVAWVETQGTVQSGNSKRPLRLSAVLVRQSDRWFFREMVFQWDEVKPSRRDLLTSGLYLQLFNSAFGRPIGTYHQSESPGRATAH